MTPDNYNRQDCAFFHASARDALRMARSYLTGDVRRRIMFQERAADYREALIDQMRRRAGWTLAERIANKRNG